MPIYTAERAGCSVPAWFISWTVTATVEKSASLSSGEQKLDIQTGKHAGTQNCLMRTDCAMLLCSRGMRGTVGSSSSKALYLVREVLEVVI